MNITYEDFIRAVEDNNGEVLPTVGGRATFTLNRTERGVSFTPDSSGIPRQLNRESIEGYLDYFNTTKSTNTSDYSKNHRNQSYVLAIIKLILDQSPAEDMLVDGASPAFEIDPEFSAPEGEAKVRSHRYRERSRELVRMAKLSFRTQHGRLYCQVCSFDFGKKYGEPDFIEVHHLIPLRDLKPDHKTKISELAMVCPNCHRMLHRGSPWPTIDELKSKIEKNP